MCVGEGGGLEDEDEQAGRLLLYEHILLYGGGRGELKVNPVISEACICVCVLDVGVGGGGG